MRTREIKKQFWLNEEEAKLLSNKAYKVGLSESELIRFFIRGFEPREKPDDRFYDAIKQLRIIGININQIAKIANTRNFIDKEMYLKDAEIMYKLIDLIKNEFLRPKKIDVDNIQ